MSMDLVGFLKMVNIMIPHAIDFSVIILVEGFGWKISFRVVLSASNYLEL